MQVGGGLECLNYDEKLCWAGKMPSPKTLLKQSLVYNIRGSSIADKASNQEDDKLY